MSTREKALKEPERKESLVFAMIYVGDQIAEAIRVMEHNQVVGTAAAPFLPAETKAPKSEPPRPKGGTKKPPAATHGPGDGSEDFDPDA